MVNHTGTKLVKYIHRKGPLLILINKKMSKQKDVLNNSVKISHCLLQKQIQDTQPKLDNFNMEMFWH